MVGLEGFLKITEPWDDWVGRVLTDHGAMGWLGWKGPYRSSHFIPLRCAGSQPLNRAPEQVHRIIKIAEDLQDPQTQPSPTDLSPGATSPWLSNTSGDGGPNSPQRSPMPMHHHFQRRNCFPHIRPETAQGSIQPDLSYAFPATKIHPGNLWCSIMTSRFEFTDAVEINGGGQPPGPQP